MSGKAKDMNGAHFTQPHVRLGGPQVRRYVNTLDLYKVERAVPDMFRSLLSELDSAVVRSHGKRKQRRGDS